MKKIGIVTFIFIALAMGTYLYLAQIPSRITPFPYVINYKEAVPAEAENANVLIVGDRLAHSLNNFNDILIEKVSSSLSKPIKIFNWGTKGEGAHRTLHKLKQMKQIPRLVIYYGGSEEFNENRANITDHHSILRNFEIFKNDVKLTAITIFPFLSRLIYQSHNIVYLNKKIISQKKIWPLKKMIIIKELIYKIYKQETLEIIKYSQEKDFHLIVIIPPHNLEVPVQKVCPSTTSGQTVVEQNEVSSLLNEGDFKSAYNEALILTNQSPFNARNHYLLGMTSKKIGKLQEAIESLKKASIYDCELWRGTPILNKILKQNIQKTGVNYIDFNQQIQSNFSKNILFFDEIYPQHIFYEKLLKTLKEKIKRDLNI